jgi:tRNA dimethylallyltransferase
MGDKRPVVCIVGPTATGKSDIGVWLAEQTGGEVISADSMQVYRGMDIGTAKLKPDEMRGVPHHLIDVVAPDEPYSVADWTKAADAVISRLHKCGKLPIVVGGTGLYIRSITEDLDFAAQKGSSEVRNQWQAFADAHGTGALHQELAKRDGASANRLHPNDVRRIVRALEVYEVTGRPLSEGYHWGVRGGRYETLQFGLEMGRELLYSRVERRVDHMLSLGLMDEVQGLLQAGYSPDLQSMQAIGYKEPVQYLLGNISQDEAVADLKKNTRRFVKRQFSWFRRDERVQWLHLNENTRAKETFGSTMREQALQLLAGI